MEFDWRVFGADPLPPTLTTAVEVFATHGYHGASIRRIAEAAGLSVPGLYHHYKSKQAILDAGVTAIMAEMLRHTRAARAAATGPEERFNNIVEALIRFHLERRVYAFVASTEMRSMEPDLYRRHVAQRDAQQRMVTDAITECVSAAIFVCPHPSDAARAICSLCVSISTWYKVDGKDSPAVIVERYLSFARRIAGSR